MSSFDIPVVLFIFKRNKAVEIVQRISLVRPSKLYILADHGRTDEERAQAVECRKEVEKAINWNCEIVRNYSENNRGVYENIAEGAKWVLRQEKWAIFLEDDNLPEVSFFKFCDEMLRMYENDSRVIWVCGTNYLGRYSPPDGASYVFTKHMLPCGWASWANKFEKFYCGDLSLCEDKVVLQRIKRNYVNKKIYRQYSESWLNERRRILSGNRPISWDYQMDFTIKANNLWGICPCNNQIKNIGVDTNSIHGGDSFNLVMTRRFCGMESYPIDFPLKHPKLLLPDEEFEKKIGKIILYPLRKRIKSSISKIIRKVLRVPKEKRIVQYVKDGFK